MIVLIGWVGAVAGAVGLSVLTVLLYAAIEPESFGDGQFVIVLVFTILLGALLGVVTSLVVHQVRQRRPVRAGWIATAGGAVTLALATAIVWGSADSRGGGVAELTRTLLSLWIAPSWFAAAALTIWGTYRLVVRR